jgi:hypothetical protein
MSIEIFDREIVTAWKGTHGVDYSLAIDGRKFWTMLEFDTIFSSKKGTWYLYKVPWIESTPVWFRMGVYEGSRIEHSWPRQKLFAGQFVWNADNTTITLEHVYDLAQAKEREDFLIHVRDHNPCWILDLAV